MCLTPDSYCTLRADLTRSSGSTLYDPRAQIQLPAKLILAHLQRWLTVRILLLSALIISSTGVVLVAAGDKVSPAKAGFTLTFALEISQNILYLVQHYTSLELSMVGVERIKEYCEIAQEVSERFLPYKAS